MLESILMAGAVWLAHAGVGGLPAIVAFVRGKLGGWLYPVLLVVVPFWALLPAQILWPVGGMSSYIVRLIVLTAIVFIAELVEVLIGTRKSPAWVHPLLLGIATLSVIPLQLVVPSLQD